MNSSLQGRRVLVTGSAGGIGAAIVARFKAEGAQVVGLDLKAAALDPSNAPNDCHLLADLRSDASLARAMETLKATVGLPDILVHAAASLTNGGVLDTEPDHYAEIYNVNVLGAVRLMRHCVPAMKERGDGCVLLVSSINADFGTPTQAAYAASKAALNNLAKSAALEFASTGVRVNVIAPASIDTPPLRDGLALQPDVDKATTANMQRHPIARFGTAAEVAALACFLAGDTARWITGAVYPIDGGASATRR